ncbi:MAG: hypothetical protein WBP34_03345, partial [Thermoanaerobaculia bacterium]
VGLLGNVDRVGNVILDWSQVLGSAVRQEFASLVCRRRVRPGDVRFPLTHLTRRDRLQFHED